MRPRRADKGQASAPRAHEAILATRGWLAWSGWLRLQRRTGQEKVNAIVIHSFRQHLVELPFESLLHTAIAQRNIPDVAVAVIRFAQPGRGTNRHLVNG